MQVLGSKLNELKYKSINQLSSKEKNELAQEFTSLLWNEVLKSSEKANRVLESKLSASMHQPILEMQSQFYSVILAKEQSLNAEELFKSWSQAATPTSEVLGMGYFTSKEEFEKKIKMLIKHHNPHPEKFNSNWIFTESAAQTDWGRYIAYSNNQSSYNLFNLPAGYDWAGPVAQHAIFSHDGESYKREDVYLRSYNSFEESIVDYFDFLNKNQNSWKSSAHAKEFFEKIDRSIGVKDSNSIQKRMHILSNLRKI